MSATNKDTKTDAKSESKEYKLGHKFLGKTGVKVSEICLGAMTFGQKEKNAWGMPTSLETESQAMLDHYVSVGGNFIDTANVYGESEIVIGNWMAKRSKENPRFRESLFIATKVHGLVGSGPNDRGCSRKHIMEAVDNSLKRLQTSYIDLYQCHSFDYRTSVREVVSIFNTLIQQGKIRYFWSVQLARHANAGSHGCRTAIRMGTHCVSTTSIQFAVSQH